LPDLLPDPKSVTLGESDPVNGLWPNGKARDKGNGKEKASSDASSAALFS
jgi:hypothetical protein